MRNHLPRIAVKWGAILGVIVVVWTLALHALGFYTVRIGAGQVADNISTVFPILVVILAVLEVRRFGELGFADGAVVGAGVGLTSAAISVPFLWIYHHVINPRWVDILVDWRTAKMRAAGASEYDLTMAEAAQRASSTDAAQAIAGLVGSVVLCLILAVVATAFLRRRRAAAA